MYAFRKKSLKCFEDISFADTVFFLKKKKYQGNLLLDLLIINQFFLNTDSEFIYFHQNNHLFLIYL